MTRERQNRLIVAVVASLFVGGSVTAIVADLVRPWGAISSTYVADETGRFYIGTQPGTGFERAMTVGGVPESIAAGPPGPPRVLLKNGFWVGSIGDRRTNAALGLAPRLAEGETAAHVERRGWPLRSIQTRASRTNPLPRWGQGMTVDYTSSGILFASVQQSQSEQTSVLWLGFLVNTLLYSATIFPLLLGLSYIPALSGPARRRRRLAKGLCPTCKYDIGDAELCSECGWKRS